MPNGFRWNSARSSPIPEVRYVVIGCHVDHRANDDIKGDVWFDGLWLGKNATGSRSCQTPTIISSHPIMTL